MAEQQDAPPKVFICASCQERIEESLQRHDTRPTCLLGVCVFVRNEREHVSQQCYRTQTNNVYSCTSLACALLACMFTHIVDDGTHTCVSPTNAHAHTCAYTNGHINDHAINSYMRNCIARLTYMEVQFSLQFPRLLECAGIRRFGLGVDEKLAGVVKSAL